MIAKLAGGKDSDSDREKEGNYLLMMKGAPEILAERCSQIMDGQGREVEFDTAARGKFQHSYDTFADNGRRVIGFAQTRFTAQAGVVFKAEEENFPTCGLTFLGTCAIMDPPREESASAIKQCYEAGIKVCELLEVCRKVCELLDVRRKVCELLDVRRKVCELLDVRRKVCELLGQ
jgi:magnesium-transporting ATPase (P-type)